jgi:hypothetical protein
MVYQPWADFEAAHGALLTHGQRRDWVVPVVHEVSQRFQALVDEVLAAVKSTELSLHRLARPKRTDGLSDDDKIRLQLYLDVVAFAALAAATGVPAEDNVSLGQVMASVEACKPAALTDVSTGSTSNTTSNNNTTAAAAATATAEIADDSTATPIA